VKAGRIIFIAGQTALDRDGNVVGRKDFAAQADGPDFLIEIEAIAAA